MLLISQLYVFCIAQINVLLRRFAVGDEGGQVLEVAERDDRFLADLGRIDHAVDVIRAVDNGTLDLGFKEGGIGHACGQRHAGRAPERLVNTHGGQRFDRGQADKRIRSRAVNAAERDNIEVIVLGGLAQRTERVGNDRNPLFCHEKPQQTQGGRAGVDKNGITVRDLLGGRRPMRDLSIWLRPERWASARHQRDRSGHAAVYLGDVAALLKLVQVAADGILGHAKNLAQLVNADGLARDDILLYRIETADFHIHSSHYIIYPPSSIRMYP